MSSRGGMGRAEEGDREEENRNIGKQRKFDNK
jgi:hypothetical protein